MQESPKSELLLERYGEKSFRDLCLNSRKWLWLYFKIFLDSRVSVGKMVDYGLILDKYKGFFVKLAGVFWFGISFEREKAWTRSIAHGPHAALVHGGPRTEDTVVARRRMTAMAPRCAEPCHG
jgi:hypothetical protein